MGKSVDRLVVGGVHNTPNVERDKSEEQINKKRSRISATG